MSELLYETGIEYVRIAFEAVGACVLLFGIVGAMASYIWKILRHKQNDYAGVRRQIGRTILLGLEILVAGDIIGTVAVSPTLKDVGVLATIVLIRTFLSFSLEVEISGQLPWRRIG